MLYPSMLFDNFGIRELSVLKGNLGHLSFRYLTPPDFEADLVAEQPRTVRYTFWLKAFAKAKAVRVAGAFNG